MASTQRSIIPWRGVDLNRNAGSDNFGIRGRIHRNTQTYGLTNVIVVYFEVFSCYNVYTMPTILFIMGWRFFFYANEGHEPIHIHCKKGDKECKYWLDSAAFEVEEAHSYNMNNADKREVKKIIFEYFDLIEDEWNKFQRER